MYKNNVHGYTCAEGWISKGGVRGVEGGKNTEARWIEWLEGAEKYYCWAFFFTWGVRRQMKFNKFNIGLEEYTATIIVSHDSFIKKKGFRQSLRQSLPKIFHKNHRFEPFPIS